MTGSHFPMQGKAEGAHFVKFFQIYLLAYQLRIVILNLGAVSREHDYRS
jgi:hypothetical protein